MSLPIANHHGCVSRQNQRSAGAEPIASIEIKIMSIIAVRLAILLRIAEH
jgi:hypothetical protein